MTWPDGQYHPNQMFQFDDPFPAPFDAGGGNDAFTVLLLHCDGTDASTTFADSSSLAHAITANGNAQIDTAQSVFGGASALFDGSGDTLTTTDSSGEFDFGTGDFTVDGRIRLSSLSPEYISVFGGTNTGNFAFGYRSTTERFFIARSGVDIDSSSNVQALSINTWYHVAVARSGTTYYFFLDGTQIGTGTNSTSYSITTPTVGGDIGSGTYPGWIDELRVSKGIARWTANFTPPTVPYF